MRVDKAYSEVKKKPKSIDVRPGLALGVITLQVETQWKIDLYIIFSSLQAGAKGLQPQLHLQGT